MPRHYALGLILVSLLGASANANTPPLSEGLKQTKLTLCQAIVQAEKHVDGNAVSAVLTRTLTGWIYDIEVISAHKKYDVAIDANQGQVIYARHDFDD
jgi:uncharacterized membrane protein YkoI